MKRLRTASLEPVDIVLTTTTERISRAPDGHTDRHNLGPEAWTVVIPDHFSGYVSWNEFQAIQAQLRNNSQPFGRPNPLGAPREGPALLQGRVMCGRCGSPMYVRYNRNPPRPAPHGRDTSVYPGHRRQVADVPIDDPELARGSRLGSW